MPPTLGIRRAIQQCAQPNGTFAMLAMDQRGSLIRALNTESAAVVSYTDVTSIKRDVVGSLSPHASAVLLDVEYGYGTCVSSGSLSGQAGLLLAIEKSGYEGDPTARRTALLDNWSVERARKAGASGIKLLVYYRPDAPNAPEQEALVATVSRECHHWGLPLFLEPLHYSLDPTTKTVPNDERREVVIESARRLTPLGVDILKAEFPVDAAQTNDRGEWTDACAELSDSCPVPWVLLSAGVDFATYVDQVQTACASGASGILCGRAVWKESVQMSGTERTRFLQTTAADRFRQLSQIVAGSARPYTDFYPGTSGDELEKWYTRTEETM